MGYSKVEGQGFKLKPQSIETWDILYGLTVYTFASSAALRNNSDGIPPLYSHSLI